MTSLVSFERWCDLPPVTVDGRRGVMRQALNFQVKCGRDGNGDALGLKCALSAGG